MKQYVGLDVAQKETSVCLLDGTGGLFTQASPNPIQGP